MIINLIGRRIFRNRYTDGNCCIFCVLRQLTSNLLAYMTVHRSEFFSKEQKGKALLDNVYNGKKDQRYLYEYLKSGGTTMDDSARE